jgi:hypothetical protein
MGSGDFTERRQFERAKVKNIVVGILNADTFTTIGLVNDISLGGVNFIHEVEEPAATPIQSIDLIADNKCLNNLPCEYAWELNLDREPSLPRKDLRQCGIQFGQLNPNQIFLLRSLINRCTALGIKRINIKVHQGPSE